MNNKILQQGRSMIEMLGVLAIIGVLSAGGIAGYSTAMESYKVNKFMEMVSFAAAQTQTIIKTADDSVYDMEQLCDLHIVPDEVCRTDGGEEGVRKGYFGESLEIDISADARTQNRPTTASDGVTELDVMSPSIFTEVYFYSKLSPSICAKIIANKAWDRMGEFVFVYKLQGAATRQELPLPPAKAIEYCTAESDGYSSGLSFGIIIFTAVTGITETI